MRKMVSMLVALAMILTIAMPTGVVAQGNTVKVTYSAQGENAWLMPKTEVEVAKGIAAEYGYKNDDTMVGDGISALDCLVAMHVALFGGDFTKENKDDYLAVSDTGYVTNVFATGSSAFGYTVNGEGPNDGNYSGDYGALAYSVNQAVVNTNDSVDFYLYADTSMWGDFLTWFEQDGVRVSSITTRPNQSVELNLKGYMFAWGSSYEPGSAAQAIMEMYDAQLALVDQDGNMTELEGCITDDEGNVEFSLPNVGEYSLTAIGTDDSEYMFMPLISVRVENAANAVVPEDFENDLWLQYDVKNMKIGETAEIYPRRVPQVVKSASDVDFERPEFTYEIVEGNSVKLDSLKSKDAVNATAISSGKTVVKVSYDELNAYDKSFGACSAVNEAYVVFNVEGRMSTATVETDINLTSYDTVYFEKGDTVDYAFSVNAQNANAVRVTCNGVTLDGVDGRYTAKLENRNNIIAIEAADSKGYITSVYKTIDARKIEIKQEKKADGIYVSFKGIANPIYKLVGMYNPSFYNEEWGSKGTFVEYIGDEGVVKGYCEQWDLATNNTIIINQTKPGEHNYTGGRIFTEWWGEELGFDKEYKVNPGQGGIAKTCEGYFSILPDFSVVVDEQVQPTEAPTTEPTVAPTKNPTLAPTDAPTAEPTAEPTVKPTKKPSKPSVKTPVIKVKRVKKSAKISWTKKKGYKYKVEMAVKNGRFKTAMKYKAAKKTIIKKLKKNKKYRFRVKAYRIVSGKKYYSKYSKVKKIKI